MPLRSPSRTIRDGMADRTGIYEIRLHGHLGENMRSAFPDLVAETRGHGTVLRGPLRDRSALHGVLAQIEGLGLELLELRRLP